MNETFNIGLQVMAYGMGGTFIVLILFYVLTKFMLFIFKKFPEKFGD